VKTQKITTKCGRIATPIEDEPLLFLVKVAAGAWWLVELDHRDGRIQDADLDYTGRDGGWHAPGTVRKFTKREGSTFSGWIVEYAGNNSDPISRQDEALSTLHLMIVSKRKEREARAAEYFGARAELARIARIAGR